MIQRFQPGKSAACVCNWYTSGLERPRDHHDGNAECARCCDLRICRGATRVLRHDQFDAFGFKQRALCGFVEWSACEDEADIGRQAHFTRGIDRTGDVIVLRRGCEGTDLKPTETEEYARRRFAERAGCSYRIGNVDPTVAGLFRPSRAPEGAQRYSGLPASRNSVAGNIRCIGVRRIDDRFELARRPAIARGRPRRRIRRRGLRVAAPWG